MGKAKPAGANEVAPGKGNLLVADHLGKETNAGAVVVRGYNLALGCSRGRGHAGGWSHGSWTCTVKDRLGKREKGDYCACK